LGCIDNYIFFFGQCTIFFCIKVIFIGFLTSGSAYNFYNFYIFLSALTNVNPLDFDDRSDLAVLRLAFGETRLGNCFDKDNKLVGLALELPANGVLGHILYSVRRC